MTGRRGFLKIVLLTAAGLVFPPMSRVLCAKRKPAAASVSSEPLELSRALKAKRWGMAVDTAKCPAGCRDCVDACHLVHNVPDFGNPKDEIYWIAPKPCKSVFPAEVLPQMSEDVRNKPVLILCNHCDNPPCVRVCPTKATFRRADGIVMMDYHRCIGCRFCMAACPYGARSMNYRDPRPFIKKINPDFPTRTKGVVEKCNFCDERLARGLLPACVAACKEKALIFGDVENPNSEIRRRIANRFPIRRRAELGTRPQVYYLL